MRSSRESGFSLCTDLRAANLILMDEPTNDLDVNTIRSLEEASLASLMPIFPACHTLFPLYMTGFFFSIPQTGHS